MKVAIYVEGITEAGFVYQLIGEKYKWDWTKVRLECLNLDPSDAADDLRDIGIENAPNYFLIYDSCTDTSVASDIRERFQSHKDQGFDKVVGLRDVYFHPYSKLEEIFKSMGKTYSKHWREIKEIVFKLKSEDFQNLYNSGKCQSFKEFCDTIFL